jgi:phospholipase C
LSEDPLLRPFRRIPGARGLRRAGWIWATALVAILTLTLFAVATVGSDADPPPASPIRHIVVILQENHSFDNLLGGWCHRQHRCDGAVRGRLSNGRWIPLREAPDRISLVSHDNHAHRRSWDRGAMDGFNRVRGCGAAQRFGCYVQYQPSDIPNLARLARHFVVADHIFESNGVPSWGSHLELATGGNLDGFTGRNPVHRPGIPRNGWGCDSLLNAPWRAVPGGTIRMEPSCVPDRAGKGPYRPSPVQWVPTIMDRLDAASVSWKLYTLLPSMASQGYPIGGYGWAICPTFADCLYTKQAANDVPLFNVLHDASAGTLPNFAIVTPASKLSQHNGYSMLNGDNYIGTIMSALMHGPEWNSTAVIITYDDYGGFYDHVPSPNGTPAIRLPFVVVSPWAKPAYTDHTYGTLGSIDAFVEHTFGLQPLTARDATAYDLHNAFDFAQSPQPAVPMTHTPVPRQELRAIRRHPPPADVT